jgi:hypothetical protein
VTRCRRGAIEWVPDMPVGQGGAIVSA